MKISKDLFLVLPVQTEQGESYVHAKAISRETFNRYYAVMGQAFSKIYKDGLDYTVGPRLAALYIRSAAERLGVLEDVEKGLLGEITRLANVAVCGENGWEMVPLSEAKRNGALDEDELDEVENALAFFTLAYSIHKRNEREAILSGGMSLWGGRLTSSDYTAFLASLPTSTATDNSGAKAPASSVPC